MKKLAKCLHVGCNNKQNALIGKCKYCNNIYCVSHRLTESHCCINISDCYDEKYNNNNKILLHNKVVGKKLDKI